MNRHSFSWRDDVGVYQSAEFVMLRIDERRLCRRARLGDLVISYEDTWGLADYAPRRRMYDWFDRWLWS